MPPVVPDESFIFVRVATEWIGGLPSVPRTVVNDRAQECRKELVDAVHYRTFARDLFSRVPANGTHDAVIDAEDDVLFAKARLEEWSR